MTICIAGNCEKLINYCSIIQNTEHQYTYEKYQCNRKVNSIPDPCLGSFRKTLPPFKSEEINTHHCGKRCQRSVGTREGCRNQSDEEYYSCHRTKISDCNCWENIIA